MNYGTKITDKTIVWSRKILENGCELWKEKIMFSQFEHPHVSSKDAGLTYFCHASKKEFAADIYLKTIFDDGERKVN